MNLGIDFGSTYTIVSTYREDHEKLEALEADSGQSNVNVPSIVSERDGKLRFGTSAKEQTGKKNVNTYKAFKMLLNEEDADLIKERLYDDEHSPRWAAEQFFKYVISTATKLNNSEAVDNLVLGAPDVWFHSFDTISGRAVLRDICRGIDGINKSNVQVISEPVLASAYFAYNFMKRRNIPFEGTILIIDYGGGTLDLSLAKVNVGMNQSMEIRMLESNGAGENTDHSIGNAGIVYMESLMEYVIRKKTPELADELIGTPDFFAAVNQLEKELFTARDEIEDTYESLTLDYLDELECEILVEDIECGDELYEITYADMLVVYNDKIRGILDEKMEEMRRWAIDEHGIDLLISDGDKTKIALVGGFGNFYLVKQQMRRKFELLSKDYREKDIIETIQDRERAISYGAALIAANIIGVRNTAPYSIGICSKNGNVETVDYMVEYRQEIELNKAYYIQDKFGEDKVFSLAQNELKDFKIDYGRANDAQIKFVVRDEFQKKLSGLVKNSFKTCAVGISFGNSDVISLHIREFLFDEIPQKFSDEETIIELGQFKEVFKEI